MVRPLPIEHSGGRYPVTAHGGRRVWLAHLEPVGDRFSWTHYTHCADHALGGVIRLTS